MPVVKEFVRFLVAHSIISKATVKMLLGWFLYIPLVIVPILIVSVLLFVSRKMNTRAICIVNQIIASGMLLMSVTPAGCRWAGSPPPRPHGPISVLEVMVDAVILFWFVGAIRLFSGKPLAWIGSVMGAGASVSFFAACLIAMIIAYVYPDAEMNRVKDFGNGGYVFALVAGLTSFAIPLAICLRLLLGLFKMRKEIVAPT